MDIIRDSVDIRARIGYLPRDSRFYEHMTALQRLEFTARFFYAGPQPEIDKRVDEIIEPVFSWLPFNSTVVSCIIFIAVAIWRFNRQEF